MPVTIAATSTGGRRALDVGQEVSLDAFALFHHAIQRHEQVWAYCKGQAIRLCPHALGWRGAEPCLLALTLQDRREPIPAGGSWEWLMEWQWLRLADLQVPRAWKGEWITCPREQRPAASDYLTSVYDEAD